MAVQRMINYLELTWSPICNYDFSVIKDDEYFQATTANSMLYMITQRKELTFECFSFEPEGAKQIIMHCEIRQKGNVSTLKCAIPIYQPNLAADESREIKFHFTYALPKPSPLPQTFPQFGLAHVALTYHDDVFIGWLSPENLIQNYVNGRIEGNIEGPIGDFVKYHVHYVGKATEQQVWKRLTGHATLQKILSEEFPMHYGTLPTHEIAVLFFKVRDYYKVMSIAAEDPITEETANLVLDMMSGNNLPDFKNISLDAEKALIRTLKPKYNKEVYNNYPLSKDGLYSYNLDKYTFQIHSMVTLTYEHEEIVGKPNLVGSDTIIVEKGKSLKIIKYDNKE